MMFEKLFKRKSNASGIGVINDKIEGIKGDIDAGSADVIQKLSLVQKQLRKSKRTLVIEVEQKET